MYLSKLVIDHRNSFDVRLDLADVRAMHRRVMSAFPDTAQSEGVRARFGVLHRIDSSPRTGLVTLLVQSHIQPDWTSLPSGYLSNSDVGLENPNTKSVEDVYSGLQEGQIFRFRLRANPTKKVRLRSDSDERNLVAKRVELQREQEQIEWLSRKGKAAGFSLVNTGPGSQFPAVRVSNVEKLLGGFNREDGSRVNKRRLTIVGVLYEGLLQINELDPFRQALNNGIGPGKAFGCGLLSLAPRGG